MTNNPTDNERNTVVHHDNDVQDVLEDLDNNTWVAPDDMQNLPTHISKDNLLSQASCSTILRTEPCNREISFEPSVMDKKLWSNMSRFLKNMTKSVVWLIVFHQQLDLLIILFVWYTLLTQDFYCATQITVPLGSTCLIY